MKISVILCTYNPREDYLRRTLQSLREQTLPQDFWEFLIVDNNSDVPVKDLVTVDWHPQGRIVVEEKPGLTHARVCGIKYSSGELLVFVDDDNLLDGNYLENALKLKDENSKLGCFGAARLIPEFEEEPHPYLRKFIGYLAVREFGDTQIGEDVADSKCVPWGAGLCVLREVAHLFLESVTEKSALQGLGRKGSALLSGEDLLFSWLAVREGFCVGVHTNITLRHLISSDRVQKDYLVRIAAGQAYSAVVLNNALGQANEPSLFIQLRSLVKTLFVKNPWRIGYEFPFGFERWKARRRAFRDARIP